MFKNVISIYFLLCLVTFGHAQIITIKDQSANKTLELATIISQKSKPIILTNANGQANISAFRDVESIQISLLGYETRILSYSDIMNADYQIALTQTNINLDQIVVSATRWQQSSNNIPARISSITADNVAFQNPQTAADLLGISGKVYIQKSQQGGGSPMIRGFATNRLLYSVDGVRMNNAIFRSGNLQNVINLDPFATEKTEVLFGPGSVIYGSDAIGGVMSFQTLTPQLSLTEGQTLTTGKAVTRYSSANNEKTIHFDINVGWKKWAFVTSVSSWDFGNLRQGRYGPEFYVKPIFVQRQNNKDIIITQDDPLLQIPSGYTQANLMQKVRFRPNEKWDIQYGFHYSQTSDYGRYDRNTRYRNGTLRYAEWNYGPQSWMMNNLSVNHIGNNAVYDEVTIRIAQQTFEESRVDRNLNNNNRNTTLEKVQAYSINVDFTKSLSEKNKLIYGAEYVINDIKSDGNIKNISTGLVTNGPSRYPYSTWSSLGFYINDEHRISDKFTAVGGARFNNYALDADFIRNIPFYPLPYSTAKLNNSSVTGSIGGVYRPSSSWVISSNFGTAFRAPNLDDIGKTFDSELGGVTVPNPDLKAEYAYNTDLGIAKTFGNAVKIDISGYYTNLQNALVKRNFQLGGLDSIVYNGVFSQVQAIQNAAVANVYGIQAGIDIKLGQGFSLSSDINYQVGTEELDDASISASRHAPPTYGVTRLNYKADRLQLQFYSTYMVERKFEDLALEEQSKVELYAKDEDGNNFAPAWYTFNIKASYDLSETFSINAGVENIADMRYRPYSSGISAPGRNFVFSMRANF